MNHLGEHIGPDAGDPETPIEERRPRIVTFGGGKGGAGRSTLCAEVARSIARRDESVLCLDADWNCPSLDTLLHLEGPDWHERPQAASPLESEDSHIGDVARATQTDGIELASIASSRQFPFVRPQLAPGRLTAELRELDVDWVLIDLPPGFDPFAVGLFALSDIPLMVSTPEPISVRKATQFLRTSLFHAIGHHPGAPDVRDSLQELLYDQPLELDVDTLLEDAPEPLRSVVESSIEQFEPYLTVNFVREGAEEDLGYVLCHAWHEEIGVYPRFLTPVDYEDRRWFYHRRSTGNDAVRGEETRSRDIEKLTQSLLEIGDIDEKYPRPIPRGESLSPALRIGLDPDRNRNRIRQHCRQLWEGYGREDAVALVFRHPEERERVTEELETLYREVLTLPSNEYDTVEPSNELTSEGTPESTSSPHLASAPDPSGASASRSDAEVRHRNQTTAGRSMEIHSTPSDSTSASPGDEVEASPEEAGPAEGSGSEPHSGATGTRETSADDVDPQSSTRHESSPPWLPAEHAPPGRILETLRRRDDVTLQELSLRTNIGAKYLTALEDADIDALPRPVYLRGYLQEIARFFDVDPDELVEAYFERLNDPPDLNE